MTPASVTPPASRSIVKSVSIPLPLHVLVARGEVAILLVAMAAISGAMVVGFGEVLSSAMVLSLLASRIEFNGYYEI